MPDELTTKEKLAKLADIEPYIDLCLDKKTMCVTLSVDLLYQLVFEKKTI